MEGRTFESYSITNLEDLKYIKYAKKELAFILNDDRFLTYRNIGNKLKKHLGFTTAQIRVPKGESYCYEHRIVVHDKQKLMLFRIKYGL